MSILFSVYINDIISNIFLLSNIERSIFYQGSNMTEQGLSNIIYGMALMGAKWHELSPKLRQEIEQAMCMKFHTLLKPKISADYYIVGGATPILYTTPHGSLLYYNIIYTTILTNIIDIETYCV